MRTKIGGWLGRGCVGAVLVLAGCGGATVSGVDQTGDASDSGGGKVGDAGTRPDSTQVGDTSQATDVTIPTDVTEPNDVMIGPNPDVVSPPDVVVMLPDVGTPVDAPPPPVDAGAGCPGTAPMNFSACMMAGLACDYGTNDCTCTNAMRWDCHTCPATQPTDGAMCQGGAVGGATVCAYGSTDCACAGGTWSCGSCPATEPMAMSACTVGGLSCDYDAGTCRCGGAFGPGGNETWACQAPCPSMQPNPGDMCTGTAAQQCMYGMTTCFCRNGSYFCN